MFVKNLFGNEFNANVCHLIFGICSPIPIFINSQQKVFANLNLPNVALMTKFAFKNIVEKGKNKMIGKIVIKGKTRNL